MTRARDMANLGSQAGSGLDASDITTGVLPVGVTGGSGLTALGTVTAGNLANTAIVYPAGHVLQVVSDSANRDSKRTTTAQSFVEDTGYSVTITPSNTSNKILVTATGCLLQTVYNKSILIRLSRDGGSSAIFEAGAYRDSNVSHEREYITLTKLDQPNSTSALTYKVYIKVIQTNGSCVWGEESSGSYEDCATITAMEING